MKPCTRCRKAPRRSPAQRYCAACHAQWKREHPAVNQKLEAVAVEIEAAREGTAEPRREGFDRAIEIVRAAKL